MGIRSFLSNQKGKYLKGLRAKQIAPLKPYFSKNTTIISNNCLGGFLYQDLELPYLTPTIGLYFFFPDYIEFLSDLKTNLNSEIKFVETSKYVLGNERMAKSKKKYPVGVLNETIEIHFLHYESEEEVISKWKRRVERINLDDLIVLGTELDLCSAEDISNFDKLSFERKYFFTREDHSLNSSIFIKEFKNNPKIGDPYQNGHVLYKNLADKMVNNSL